MTPEEGACFREEGCAFVVRGHFCVLALACSPESA
nr:MAG TPA: hypothetical protein [Caudoviricetes sp.]